MTYQIIPSGTGRINPTSYGDNIPGQIAGIVRAYFLNIPAELRTTPVICPAQLRETVLAKFRFLDSAEVNRQIDAAVSAVAAENQIQTNL